MEALDLKEKTWQETAHLQPFDIVCSFELEYIYVSHKNILFYCFFLKPRNFTYNYTENVEFSVKMS